VDPNTYKIVASHGVKLVSDAKEKDNLWPKRIEAGLISHPMNVLVDHDHLYHAHRTHEYVERINKAGYGADEFGAVSYPIDEWGRLALRQAKAIDDLGGIATLCCHPLCQWLADGFKTFEMLLKYFSMRQTIFARDILDHIDHPPANIAEQLREEKNDDLPDGRRAS
jgi:hypothetical protein